MEKRYEKKYEVRGHVLTYQMPKEVDHHVAQQLCRELDMLVEAFAVQELELDFEKTEFMDSSGIGLLIGRYKSLIRIGADAEIINANKEVKRILDMAGIFKIMLIKEEIA